jgi:hypothetical protein
MKYTDNQNNEKRFRSPTDFFCRFFLPVDLKNTGNHRFDKNPRESFKKTLERKKKTLERKKETLERKKKLSREKKKLSREKKKLSREKKKISREKFVFKC